MRYISELIDKERTVRQGTGSVILPCENAVHSSCSVNLLALGDVGGTLLMGLRMLGGGQLDDAGGEGRQPHMPLIREIGIYDLNEKLLRRYEREINQICFPDGRMLPHVRILKEEELFCCDMFVFCASKGAPPVGADGDVRMLQFKANKELISIYAKRASQQGFTGIFAVVSDPVDPLCKTALDCGLAETRVQGYGLGVMNGRAAYYSAKDPRFAKYLKDGRAFGPHGADLVIADSITCYDHEKSLELTELTVRSNMETRADGFKPYIAPALSSGAISIIETLKGSWNYSSVYLGKDGTGAFLGCRNRRTKQGIEIEDMPLDDRLFSRIENAYGKLETL